MKKLIIGLIILALVGPVYASRETIGEHGRTFIDTITISADTSSDVALEADLKGRYIIQAYIETSADDAVTITIKKSSSGATIGTLTTTAGTTGEFIPLAEGVENRYITETPYYSLSSMASGTATVEIVSVK